MKKICGFGLLLLLAACAKDKSAEDFQREKLQRNLALYDSVAGSYSGIVNSQETSEVLGAMELNLRVDTKPNDSNNNSGDMTGATPILVGSVNFLDQTIISLSAPNGYYDPNTGLYSADISITRAGGSGSGGGGGPKSAGGGGGGGMAPTETVRISGILGGDALSGGVLQHVEYPGFGGTFQLLKNRGVSLQEQLQRVRPGKGRGDGPLIVFYGETRFKTSGQVRPVNIIALRPNRGTSEDFLDIVNPIKHVQVGVSYGSSLQFLFPDALYDVRQGVLTGELTILVNDLTQKMNIECHRFAESVECKHNSSGFGLVATTVAKVSDGKGIDIPDGNDRVATTRNYTGSSKMPGDRKPRKVALKVVYPARSRYQDLVEQFFPVTERYLQVSISFSEFASPAFSKVKWDSLNGQLDATEFRDGSGGSYTQYIQCDNFYFTEWKGDFTCTYSTTRSPTFRVEFKEPGKEPR